MTLHWEERAAPWWSEAFAAGGALLAGGGLLSLGLYLSQDWATLFIGLYVAVAYLAEPFLPRPGQAACTTIVALGTPTFFALVVFPIHTYNGFRVLQIATIVMWFAFFRIGGTRGRMVLLALAMTFVWVFATLEVGHVQDTARYFRGAFVPGLVTPQIGRSGSSCTSLPDGSVECSDNLFSPPDSAFSSRPKNPRDYALGIGLVSLAFGTAFVFAVRRGRRMGRRGLATAYVIPGVLSIIVAVAALGDKADHIWVTGLFALIAGVAVGVTANGERRFLTWTAAIGSAIGVALIAGDFADSLFGEHNAARDFGYTFFLFGLATMVSAVFIARLLGEPATDRVLTDS